MVQLGLDALRTRPETFEVHHINARFSETLDDIGESSLRKGGLIGKYLLQAIRLRFRLKSPLLYYVPGPVKWSAVLRDWVILGFLRLFYRKVVFHWHAIGQGEWAHGSMRLALEGPALLDLLARRISSFILDRPYASICVVHTSAEDANAVGSKRILTVCNGIKDPCPDFKSTIQPHRERNVTELITQEHPRFRILFLSHGTIEKGLLDAIAAIRRLVKTAEPHWRFSVTFAGGVSEDLELRFERDIALLREEAGDKLDLQQRGYVSGDEKHQCYASHDVFLASSRWESFGLTIVEAMAHGLQVVAAASDGAKGILPDGHPYLTPVGDPEALAESLHHCCRDLFSGGAIPFVHELRLRFLEHYQICDFSSHFISTLLSLIPARKAPNEVALRVYLADQNPGFDRSFGISRMSLVVLAALHATGSVRIHAISSQTSQQPPPEVGKSRLLPWGTRRKWVRLLTDHLHPLFVSKEHHCDLYYYPKGYLPAFGFRHHTTVVTIHDTIIQYDEDHYPLWRKKREYSYWAAVLRHTLRNADCIMTVSESSKWHILEFMERHRIPPKEITVTYEPCAYEQVPQPEDPRKKNFVIHLASVEPHKRTAHLIRWWHEAESQYRELPMLHLIGSVPQEVEPLLASSRCIAKRPFLADSALQSAYSEARALILPSEIEGFGLPALEAYYLGTPVCYVWGTSVEEILGAATSKGGFSLDSAESLFDALKQVMAMPTSEVRQCGLKLRETYAAKKVAERMLEVFNSVGRGRRAAPTSPTQGLSIA